MASKRRTNAVRVKSLDVTNKLRLPGGVELSTAELALLDGLTASAAELNILDGATLSTAELNLLDGVTATTAEINTVDGAPMGASFVVGAEGGGTTINVAVQLLDANGADLAVRGSVFGYLSNDANGDSIATSAPSGGVAIGTDGLAIPLVAGKAWMFTSEADGDIDINLIEAGGATWYLVIRLTNGKLAVSGAITFAA